jgi:hypothetical protein
MAKADFAAARKQAEDAGLLGGGDYYKCKEGDNRVRLMSMCLPHTSEFKGKRNFKWLCYVLDRRDGNVKAYFMPHKIYKAIEALQMNPDYAFEEVPMPYDITVHAKGAGTKEVEYSLIPARKETPLTADEESDLDQQKPLAELQKLLIEKQQKGNGNGQGDNQGDDAPAHSDDDEPPF